jgi:4-hydroxybenzoate polyprenyltransferase
MNRLLAYSQLLRLPNVFTAMADIFMGFLIAHGSLRPALNFGLLLASSSALYLAGMVLNDAFDFAVDLVERPGRPLPSGRIARRTAFQLGFTLLVAGVGFGWCAGRTSGTVASVLAACVLAYDAGVKASFLGPMVMGTCRALNVLLGMSTVSGAIWVPTPAGWNEPFAARLGTLAAVGLGLYVLNVTRFARREARGGVRAELMASTIGMNLGLLLLAYLVVIPGLPAGSELAADAPYWLHATRGRAGLAGRLRLLHDGALLAVAFVIVNLTATGASLEPNPQAMQRAVKTFILSIVLLDAAVVAALAGPHALAWAAVVLTLLVPALLLGRWVYST